MATKTNTETINPDATVGVAPNDEVQIHLFKDGGKYKGDVFVAVNGKRCLIKRGETVKVKQKYAEVLANSQRQDSATADLIERKSEEYRAASRFLDL